MYAEVQMRGFGDLEYEHGALAFVVTENAAYWPGMGYLSVKKGRGEGKEEGSCGSTALKRQRHDR